MSNSLQQCPGKFSLLDQQRAITFEEYAFDVIFGLRDADEDPFPLYCRQKECNTCSIREHGSDTDHL